MTDLSTVLYHDFRTPPENPARPLPPELKFLHVTEPDLLQFQAGGLIIKVPKTHMIPKWKGVGLETLFGLQGDFEITATFDNFKAETPASGPGVGPGMYIKAANGAHVLFSRVVQAKDAQVLKMDWFNNGITQVSPCTDTAGKLRCRRLGSVLDLMWAAGSQGEDFKTVFQCQFGDSPILLTQLNVGTGGMPCDQEVRVLDWRFAGQREPTGNVDPAAGNPANADLVRDAPKGSLAWALTIGLLITVTLAVGLWFFAPPPVSGNGEGSVISDRPPYLFRCAKCPGLI